ncbi:cytochrome b561 [Litoreibacter ponti]|uniref:Cytochrome b561 n=1 Tax=Litoreibacter ponti TaxID=1510457 RepID=A0A2T6BDP6_9RHOB|nr:hypothetical protein [Litoreibacter ponti]PTX54152.1 cytochrome b561 [Litoreibacter ponti]
MTRDGWNKALHWSHSGLMGLVLLAPSTLVLALYAACALAWAGIFAWRGPAHRPGPKLEGAARLFHIWGHRALYLGAAVAGISAVATIFGIETPLHQLILALFAGGMLHAIFHLWRHTTLMDGALKLILPKAMHGIL